MFLLCKEGTEETPIKNAWEGVTLLGIFDWFYLIQIILILGALSGVLLEIKGWMFQGCDKSYIFCRISI